MKAPVVIRNAMLDAIRASYNSGYIRCYAGTKPTDGDAALSGNTLLAELRFGATAFPAASGGVLTANAITADSSADATGSCTFIRCFQSDGTTRLGDFTVSTTGGGGEAQFASLAFVSGVTISLSSFTITNVIGT
jgi:hypothetical protein